MRVNRSKRTRPLNRQTGHRSCRTWQIYFKFIGRRQSAECEDIDRCYRCVCLLSDRSNRVRKNGERQSVLLFFFLSWNISKHASLTQGTIGSAFVDSIDPEPENGWNVSRWKGVKKRKKKLLDEYEIIASSFGKLSPLKPPKVIFTGDVTELSSYIKFLTLNLSMNNEQR